MKRIFFFILIISVIFSQDILDDQVVARIKMEAFQRSQVMETLSRISDVYGGRLTGSPTNRAAAEWCVTQLNEWGINARLESWGTINSGWSYEEVDAWIIKPHPGQLIAYPLAWSASTPGPITGQPVFVNIETGTDIEAYRDSLKGKIVFNGTLGKANPHFTADAERMEDSDLETERSLVTPNLRNLPSKSWKRYLKWTTATDTIAQFFKEESIAVLVSPSSRDHGVVRLTAISYDQQFAGAYPAIVLPREHFNRILRLNNLEIPVELRIDVKAKILDSIPSYNMIAEIPGNDRKLKDEVVLLGAHLDSWHAGTGATDNSGNCATLMEVLRIIKELDLKPRRTIRLALWDGEEQGFYGSVGYIKSHFGDPSTMALLPEHDKLSVYLNLDGGCGKIRGVYLQGNEMARSFFETGLEPFAYLGVGTISPDMVTSTDHMPFNWIGLPGFDMMQDPIEYWTRTHHTNMDVYEAVLEDDVKINAAVMATLAWLAANRNEKIPRVTMPTLE